MSRETKIGESAALEQGGGLRFEFIDPVEIDASLKGFAISHNGKVYAYENRCPHLGVELDWVPGVFFDNELNYLVCSTHGARFEPDTGYCVAGPCSGRSLEPVAVIEKAGELYIEDDRTSIS